MTYALIVHGGVKPLSSSEIPAFETGLKAAVHAGWEILSNNGTALDAAEQAIRVMEDDPTFNAGYGSVLNAEGQVEMDAAIMDGSRLKVGAVAVLRGIRNPISVARRLMDTGPAVMLAGEGARRFAEQQGFELVAPDSLISPDQRQEWLGRQKPAAPTGCDTVGCVALDSSGRIAAATSTGGLTGKPGGRIGDSPLVGCGLLADELGGASLTGDGESIIRCTMASRILGLLHAGLDPEDAAESAIRYFGAKVAGEAGCIVLDRRGRIGFAHKSQNLACAYRTTGMDAAVALTTKR